MRCFDKFLKPNKIDPRHDSASNGSSETVEVQVEQREESEHEDLEYPCLCNALRVVLRCSRWTGLMPIVPLENKAHANSCKFIAPKLWIVYTVVILVLFLPYVLFMYAERLTCGPVGLHSLEWYVMTFGYIITDIESIISLISGVMFAKNTCAFLENLSVVGGSLNEMVAVQKTVSNTLKVLFPGVLFVFSSYTYVAWIRFDLDFGNFYCTLLDQPFAVVIRGFTLIFPTMETTVIVSITTIIVIKFNNLAETTALAIHMSSTSGNSALLAAVARTHIEISSSLKTFNKYFGIQMLAGVTSSLYTTIYYLYRFCTATDTNRIVISNSHEKIHYLLGMLYRSSKLIIYIVLGHFIGTSSLKPLETLQNSPVITFTNEIQRQIQTLIVVWQSKKATLSGLGVISIGPWLLAPIVGNVITYLLVALQFKNTFEFSGNVTAFLESVF